MGSIEVPGPRSHFRELPSGIAVVIPARRQVFPLIFLPFWLVLWFMGARSVLARLLSKPEPWRSDPFLLVWLTLWILGGAAALLALMWNALGREGLTLEQDLFRLRREILGIGFSCTYDVSHVLNLRVLEIAPNPESMQWRRTSLLGLNEGPIAFDYGAKTVRCGSGVDPAEARMIIERLRQYQPALRTRGSG